MMYVPVMQQYPGQAQQTWAQQPGSHGSVPMMMPQGQMMMAVPQGSWGAPAAAGWGAQMQQYYGQQRQQPTPAPQAAPHQRWFGTVGGGPPPPPPPPPADDATPTHHQPAPTHKNPVAGKKARGKNKGNKHKGQPDATHAAADADELKPAPSDPTNAFKKEKGVTFPTVDEIPVLKPVDVSALPEDVRRYREERAKNWPSSKVTTQKRVAESERAARGELGGIDTSAAARAEARRAALREILAKQRELGHFEASEEIGDLDGEGNSGAPGKGKGRGRGNGQASRRPGDGERAAKAPRVGGGDAGRDGACSDGAATGLRHKTRPCRYWQLGKCRKGDACDFIHAGDSVVQGGDVPVPVSGQPCRFFIRGRCKSGRRCPFVHDEAARESAREKRLGNKRGAGITGGSRDPTLLKKLFAKEVRVDRSRLTQVFRFLVNNDFLRDFDPSGTDSRKKGLGDLWMFPWVDDPVRSTKAELRKLAAEAAVEPLEDEEEEAAIGDAEAEDGEV